MSSSISQAKEARNLKGLGHAVISSAPSVVCTPFVEEGFGEPGTPQVAPGNSGQTLKGRSLGNISSGVRPGGLILTDFGWANTFPFVRKCAG
jgi:hypothetical protein